MANRNEDDFHRIRIAISILTLVGGCLAFVISNYLTTNNLIQQQREEQVREFKSLLLKDRVSIYKEACKAVGQIIGAAGRDSIQFKSCFEDFEKLYWGEFGLVEDSLVTDAGDKFREACRHILMTSGQEADINTLKLKASIFTNACRTSSLNSWDSLFKKY
mgnify:FL=1